MRRLGNSATTYFQQVTDCDCAVVVAASAAELLVSPKRDHKSTTNDKDEFITVITTCNWGGLCQIETARHTALPDFVCTHFRDRPSRVSIISAERLVSLV